MTPQISTITFRFLYSEERYVAHRLQEFISANKDRIFLPSHKIRRNSSISRRETRFISTNNTSIQCPC